VLHNFAVAVWAKLSVAVIYHKLWGQTKFIYSKNQKGDKKNVKKLFKLIS